MSRLNRPRDDKYSSHWNTVGNQESGSLYENPYRRNSSSSRARHDDSRRCFESEEQHHENRRQRRCLIGGVERSSDGVPFVVGGRFPDGYNEYIPFYRYFVVSRLRIKGVLPCKTFLDRFFDPQVKLFIQNGSCLTPDGFWRPTSLLEVKKFELQEFKDAAADERSLNDDESVSSSRRVALPQDEEDDATEPSPSFILTAVNPLASQSQMDESHVVHQAASDVAVVVNLCLTERYYSVPQLRHAMGVDYFRFKVDGRGALPELNTILSFIELFASISRRYPGGLVALHCTHGVNRTGFFSLLLLHIFGELNPIEAASYFKRARGHGIDRGELFDYLNKLSKTTFIDDSAFKLFLADIFRIYLPAEETGGSSESECGMTTRYINSIPSAVDASDLYSILLESHYASATPVFQPLGLLEVQKLVNQSETDECYMKLTFADSACAVALEQRWRDIALESCLRKTVLPLDLLREQDKVQNMFRRLSFAQAENFSTSSPVRC